MKQLRRTRYTTRSRLGDYPAGTECWISRPEDGLLQVEFDDGFRITLNALYYAEGLEQYGV